MSVITGEFNGHSVSGLIHYCWVYFAITMAFDLLQAFVLENIEASLICLLLHRRQTFARAVRHRPFLKFQIWSDSHARAHAVGSAADRADN